MTLFWAATGAMPTTAALAPLAGGTAGAIRTMLQIAVPATRPFKVVQWGVQLSAAASVPVTCELLTTGTVAATVTSQHVAAGIQPYGETNGTPASTALIATTAQSGYNASAEGTITATRYADLVILPVGVNQYKWEWSLGREFMAAPSSFLRARMTSPSTQHSATIWVMWDE